jgi:hypothetical protein
MAIYTQYQINTGEIVVSGTTNTDVLPFVLFEGNDYLEGYGSNISHYVLNNTIVDYTQEQKNTKLNKPNYKCTWSNETFTWVDARTTEQQNIDAENLANIKRDIMLSDSDWIVIRALDQGNPIPTDWQTYRQQLRDISQQSGYPLNIIWPTPPN